MKVVLPFIITIFVCCGNLTAQTYPDGSWDKPNTPVNCVSAFSYMESAQLALKEQSDPKGVLIIIARLGDGEIRTELNRRRLFNAKETILSAWYVESGRILTAEGERVKGFGRVEFYASGKLVAEILINRNKDLPADCYEDAVGKYYPARAKIKSKKRKSKN